MNTITQKNKESKVIIRKCHSCGQIVESHKEQEKCCGCGKAFLPLNYFDKIHGDTEQKFDELFSPSEEIHEEDLILGLYVLW